MMLPPKPRTGSAAGFVSNDAAEVRRTAKRERLLPILIPAGQHALGLQFARTCRFPAVQCQVCLDAGERASGDDRHMHGHVRLAAPPSEPERPHGAETPIKVVLAVDHRSLRRNLRALLDAESNVEVVAEVADLGSTIRHVRRRRPDVLITDLLPMNGSALSSIGKLRRSASDTQIVAMTMEASRSVATRVLDAGALGYVLKEQSDRDLLPAVRAAARRERYVSPEIT
jgi:CheY-like chemotaxis protein